MLPTFDDVRERIVQQRKKIGMTQADLAEQADVSQSFIAKLERGQSTPNYEAVARLYNTLEEMVRGEEQTAAEIMTSYVVTVNPDDSVRHASGLMKAENYSQLPVVDDSGHCVGTVTTMSLLEAPSSEPVSDHMTAPLPEVPHNTSKTAVCELLTTADAVLVQRQDDGVIGIITASDVL